MTGSAVWHLTVGIVIEIISNTVNTDLTVGTSILCFATTITEHPSGAWTKEEEALLTQIVTEITVSQGKDPDNDVFWGVVSQRMNNKRGRQQCRIKW